MPPDAPNVIRIAAALIDDGRGKLLLVRKTGTEWFMQAGGKIEPGESALAALGRELREEIGLVLTDDMPRPLGRFSANAANEPGDMVQADLFHVRIAHEPSVSAEIAEAVWVDHATAEGMALAPLTRQHVIPLARTLHASPPAT